MLIFTQILCQTLFCMHILVKRSGVLVELSGLALHFDMKTSPSAADLDEIQNYLHERSFAREKAELESLKGLFNAFRKVSFLAGNLPQEESAEEQCDNAKVGQS